MLLLLCLLHNFDGELQDSSYFLSSPLLPVAFCMLSKGEVYTTTRFPRQGTQSNIQQQQQPLMTMGGSGWTMNWSEHMQLCMFRSHTSHMSKKTWRKCKGMCKITHTHTWKYLHKWQVASTGPLEFLNGSNCDVESSDWQGLSGKTSAVEKVVWLVTTSR